MAEQQTLIGGTAMKHRLRKASASFVAVMMTLNIFLIFYIPVRSFALTYEQSELVEEIGSYARDHYDQYKILPSFVAAQALQESALSVSKHPSGLSTLAREHHNYFGMTAGAGYSGDIAEFRTAEQNESGEVYYRTAKFRSYPSFEKGMEGYYAFINGNGGRYKNLIGVTDYTVACTLVKEDGWATDISYTEGLIRMINNYDLTRFDTGIPGVNDQGSQHGSGTPGVTGYFRACAQSCNSIVDGLNSIVVDSSFTNRSRIAGANGINNYTGSDEQNTAMLNKLKGGALIDPDYRPTAPATTALRPVSDITSNTTAAVTTAPPETTAPVTPGITSVTLKEGEQYTITTGRENTAFFSNNTAVAVVSAQGSITAVGEGEAIIMIFDSNYNSVQLTVTVTAAETDGSGKPPEDDPSEKKTGDVNCDGVLSKADGMLLSRYIAGWEGIVIDPEAADINGDGEITKADGMILARYLAGWEGYDMYFDED